MYEDVRGKYHVIELLKQLHATIDNCNTCPPVRALVHWPEAYNTLSPPGTAGYSGPDRIYRSTCHQLAVTVSGGPEILVFRFLT